MVISLEEINPLGHKNTQSRAIIRRNDKVAHQKGKNGHFNKCYI